MIVILMVLTATLLGPVLPHPDVGGAYNYPPPRAPFRNDAALFNGAAQHVQIYQPSSQNQYQQAQPQYHQAQAQNNVGHYQNQPQNGVGHIASSQQQQNGFHTAGYADQAGFGPQSSDVYKSLYYFDSPEDIEIPAPRFRYANEGKSSKHYKIIFIKAPAYVQQPITDIRANIGASGAGKTIIYVLTKKPDAQRDVVINAGAAHQTVSKPEVYYIKYDSKQDAEQQISQSLNGQQGGGAVQGRPLDSDHEFISTIRDNVDVRSLGPIVKNLGNPNEGQRAPQGAQILGGFNRQQQSGGFSTSNAPHLGGYSGGSGSTVAYGSSSTGYSTGAPQQTYGGASFTTDSYGNTRH